MASRETVRQTVIGRKRESEGGAVLRDKSVLLPRFPDNQSHNDNGETHSVYVTIAHKLLSLVPDLVFMIGN